MAAPTSTPRQNPPNGSYKMPDGFKTTIAFAAKPAVQFWEQVVTPSGFDTGDAINTTTMLNTRYRTMAAPKLLTSGPIKATCFFDPDCYSDIISLLGQEGSVTIHLPDGSKIDEYGFLKAFTPKEFKEKEAPLADIEIVVTNWDPANQVEQGPVFTAAVGT